NVLSSHSLLPDFFLPPRPGAIAERRAWNRVARNFAAFRHLTRVCATFASGRDIRSSLQTCVRLKGDEAMDADDFAANLRLLCSTEPSVSAVCRGIGINRQQFNKYLNGTSQPSAANLRRIALHFGIRPVELMLPPEEFEMRPSVSDRIHDGAHGASGTTEFDSAFEGQTIALRRYLGYYLSYFLTESWDNSVICALVRLDVRNGRVRCKSLERSVDPEDGSLYLSKYDGWVAMLGNRIFVMEFQSLARDALVET